VEFITLEGNPAERILNFAEKQDIDMIVVGSLGKTATERFLLGSVSERVVRNAVPVRRTQRACEKMKSRIRE
jgi:nucleotide-binding universal stress UspA family protein